MSSDVFVISAVSTIDPSDAIRLALESSGLNPSRLQDVIFGLEGSTSSPDLAAIVRSAGLACPVVGVASSLRAVFFATQSILSGDVELVLVAGLETNKACACLLASPEAVGRLNLLPRARLAVRSLAGSESALRTTGITTSDVAIFKANGDSIALLKELIEELEAQKAQWGLVSEGEFALLVERV